MESTIDYDLEEIECRLYSQVFHSTETWDTPYSSEKGDTTLHNIQTRSVSVFAINNLPTNTNNRYWGAGSDNNARVTSQSIELEHNDRDTPTQFEPSANSSNRDNNNICNSQTVSDSRLVLEYQNEGIKTDSSIQSKSLINSINEDENVQSSKRREYRSKDCWFNSILIPKTMKLPVHDGPIPIRTRKYFKMGKKTATKFRQFLKYLEQGKEAIFERDYQILQYEKRKLKEKNKALPPTILKQPEPRTNHSDVIILSDSDNDSVIEIPLPPIPTYTVDSSSEDELPPNPLIEEPIDENPINENSTEEKITENIEKSVPLTEIERDEFLHTPDSNNDFLDHDNRLTKNNLAFNFSLHSSDLDLSRDREESIEKPIREQDIYETESICSDIGPVASNSRLVFNEINFKSPTKDIFCEPDLSKFSNFITPDRSVQKTKKNKSKAALTSVQTKAGKTAEENEEIVQESQSEIDSTTLKPKKKRIKPKKRKKEKQPHDAILEKSPKLDLQNDNIPACRQKGSTDSTDSKIVECSSEKPAESISEYYKDTFFADDSLVLEEIEKQDDKSDNNGKEIPTESEISLNETGSTKSDFSFVETWRKSTENSNKDELNESFNKKQKTGDPTVHPYVVTVISDDSNSSDKSVDKSASLNESSTSDIQIVNVENDTAKKEYVANPFSFIRTYLANKDKRSFRDFWTTDMKKFYEDSWGQEHFDVAVAQSFMSDNPADWEVHQSDLHPEITNRNAGPLCFRCRKRGHKEYNCTFHKGPIKCTTCGDPGHTYIRCPNSFCTTCRTPTRDLTTSCGSCLHYRHITCLICNRIGHETKNCPDLWRRYHLTTNTRSSGFVRKSSGKLRPPGNRWCSNCATRGHYEDQCTHLGRDHFPVSPGIISYEPSYGETAASRAVNLEIPSPKPPPINPYFKDPNVTVSDLRGLRRNVAVDTNKKYVNILKQLRQKCGVYDSDLIYQIDELLSKDFNKRNIHEVYKIRARIEKNRVS